MKFFMKEKLKSPASFRSICPSIGAALVLITGISSAVLADETPGNFKKMDLTLSFRPAAPKKAQKSAPLLPSTGALTLSLNRPTGEVKSKDVDAERQSKNFNDELMDKAVAQGVAILSRMSTGDQKKFNQLVNDESIKKADASDSSPLDDFSQIPQQYVVKCASGLDRSVGRWAANHFFCNVNADTTFLEMGIRWGGKPPENQPQSFLNSPAYSRLPTSGTKSERFDAKGGQ